MEREHNRLTPDEVNQIIFLYCKLGWREAHIARKLLRNTPTIRWHIKSRNLAREVLQVTAIPIEILYTYVDETADLPPDRTKTYDDYVEEDKQHKQAECTHFHWIKRCSHCNKILESDNTHIHTVKIQREISPKNAPLSC